MRRSRVRNNRKRAKKPAFTVLKDEELVALVASGRPEAYQPLVDRYEALVRSVIGKFLGNDPMAVEDACQETFLKALAKIEGLRNRSRFKSWLCAIARNQALDTLRRRKQVISISLTGGTSAGNGTKRQNGSNWQSGSNSWDNHMGWQIPDKKPNPAEIHARHEVVGVVQNILAEIPELYREPITLRYEEDLDYQQIAVLLGKPLGTIKSLIHRGKVLIREELTRRSGGNEGAIVFAS